MRTLIVEGNKYLIYTMEKLQKIEILSKDVQFATNLWVWFDKIREYEFDTIILGDELYAIDPQPHEEKLKIELEKLKAGNHIYFPVALGEVTRNICEYEGKKIPEIVIMSTGYYYPFAGKHSSTENLQIEIEECIRQHQMKFIRKDGNVFGNLKAVLK